VFDRELDSFLVNEAACSTDATPARMAQLDALGAVGVSRDLLAPDGRLVHGGFHFLESVLGQAEDSSSDKTPAVARI